MVTLLPNLPEPHFNFGKPSDKFTGPISHIAWFLLRIWGPSPKSPAKNGRFKLHVWNLTVCPRSVHLIKDYGINYCYFFLCSCQGTYEDSSGLKRFKGLPSLKKSQSGPQSSLVLHESLTYCVGKWFRHFMQMRCLARKAPMDPQKPFFGSNKYNAWGTPIGKQILYRRDHYI